MLSLIVKDFEESAFKQGQRVLVKGKRPSVKNRILAITIDAGGAREDITN